MMIQYDIHRNKESEELAEICISKVFCSYMTNKDSICTNNNGNISVEYLVNQCNLDNTIQGIDSPVYSPCIGVELIVVDPKTYTTTFYPKDNIQHFFDIQKQHDHAEFIQTTEIPGHICDQTN